MDTRHNLTPPGHNSRTKLIRHNDAIFEFAIIKRVPGDGVDKPVSEEYGSITGVKIMFKLLTMVIIGYNLPVVALLLSLYWYMPKRVWSTKLF